MVLRDENKRFSVWLPPEDMAFVEAVAKGDGISVSKVIRKIVKECRENNPTMFRQTESGKIKRHINSVEKAKDY